MQQPSGKYIGDNVNALAEGLNIMVLLPCQSLGNQYSMEEFMGL